MDKLPQEVVDKITGFMFPILARKTDMEYDRHPRNKFHAPLGYPVDDISTRPFATLSPVWNRSVEQLTFWMLKIRSHSDALIADEAMSRDQHRRDSVRRIAWNINLDVERTSSFPSIRDRMIVFGFRNMLEFINRIRQSSGAPVEKLLLSINIVGMAAWDAEDSDSAFTTLPPGIHELPLCPAVNALQICYDVNVPYNICEPRPGRRVPPVWIVEIMSKFPSVARAEWGWYDFLNRSSPRRGRLRNEVCKALKGPLFANLQVLGLWIGPYQYGSAEVREYLATPMAEPSENGEDPLNAAIRALSQNLVELGIRGTFTLSPDLFHNRNGQGQDQPFRPRLERLLIETTNITCTGNLYLTDANQETPHNGPHAWINDILCRPTDGFNELMLCLSRGMLNMPKLRDLKLLVLCNLNGHYYPHPDGAPNPRSLRKMTIYALVNYDREANQAVPMAECTPAELWCNLGVFDTINIRYGKGESSDIEVPRPLLWARGFPEEILRNWNELHFRIEGRSVFPEWRRTVVDVGREREAATNYPVIKPAPFLPSGIIPMVT